MKQRIRSLGRGNMKLVAVALAVALFSGTAGAVAVNKIGSKQIKNNSIRLVDLKKKLRQKLNRAGGTGRTGDQGAPGTPGADAEFTGTNWSIVARNTIGSPLIALGAGPIGRSGPTAAAADVPPPEGVGSLHIATGDDTTTGSPPSDKAAFGNEVDFAGTSVAGINEIGFSYLSTTENNGGVPSIAMELEPDLDGDDGFTSMVYVPPTPSFTSNPQWFTVDAATTGSWGLSGGEAAITGCSIGGSCDLGELKAALVANNDDTNATTEALISGWFGVQKGRDTEWQGAIDALQLNDTIYDFEPLGVEEVTAP